jgi:lipopolysaccharide transport system ATP-binding protein
MRGRPDPHARLNPDGSVADQKKGEFWALRDVSFALEAGEAMAIIGKNGSGKSTLLKILSQITAPTEGTARLRGRVASMLEVGTGFHTELTGRANVYINGAILGMTRREIDSRFDEIVAFAGIEKFIDTPVKRYSSGMSVRLAFAVAAHLAAEILIVDEVLAVGDAEFQRKCLQKMGDVARSGRTILFVSHNMHTVRTLCTQALCLESGRVAATGAPDDVIRYYMRGSDEEHASTATLEVPPPMVPAFVRTVCLQDAAGNPCAEVKFGSPWCCVLEVQMRMSCEGAQGIVEVVDSDNVTLVVHESKAMPADPGIYTIRYEINELFRPGIVRLTVGAKAWGKLVFHQSAVIEMLIMETPARETRMRNTGGVILSSLEPELVAG